RPSSARANCLCPANSAAAMCSAMFSGAPGSWHTCEMSDCASAGPAARKSAARFVSAVSEEPSVRPDGDVMSSSVPWIVAEQRPRHAARPTACPHELRSFERDHGAITFGKPFFAGEKRRTADDAKAHPTQLVQRRLVALIRENDTGTHRHEVAARRPLLPLLECALLATAEHRLERHATFGERGEDA